MIGVDLFDHQRVSEPETVVACCSSFLFEDGPGVGGSASPGSSSLILRASSWSLSVPNAFHGVHIVIIIAVVVHVVHDRVDCIPAVTVHALEHAG